ncbi:MAG TPA: ABC transporter permease [Chthoniobacterales bacterium]|jgi:predicted permease|nr:ABC transporter permease [Chthoniobacterales bacterium]
MKNRIRSFFDHLRQDCSYGLRGIARHPGFAAVVVLTLGLGIGANTAIFSVVHGVLMRPLPYKAPERVVILHQAAPRIGEDSFGFSVPDFTDFREKTRAFSSLSEYHSMWFILLGRPEPERVQTGVVSDNFFDTLGVKPLLGRAFLPGEDRQGAAPVLLLSYNFWQKSFAGDPNVVGQVFQMNDKPHTVVGVLPPLPAFPNLDQVFMPAAACPFRGADRVLTNRNGRIISHVFARLKDGVTETQAVADAQRVGLELANVYPQNYPTNDGYTVRMQNVTEAFTGRSRTPLYVLLATSAFVLLIACANVANLSLSRLVLRDHELAMRVALGAGRGRILQQLITENILLAALGGIAGLALAAWGLDALKSYAAAFLPRADEIRISAPVLLFTAAISLLTGLLFGSWPRLPGIGAIKEGSRGSNSQGGRLRGLLIIGQVAVSVPLLVGAALAARTLVQLHQVDPGVDTNRVVAASLSLNFTKYNTFEKRLDFWDRNLNEIRQLPAVESVAVSGSIPLNGLANNPSTFAIEHRDVQANSASAAAFVLISSEDYFKTVGQPLLRGRFFQSGDTREAPQVAIINQSLASRYWPGQDPVGQRITFDNGEHWTTIAGVVANARSQIDSEPQDEIHLPLRAGNALTAGSLVVRTHGAPGGLRHELREAIRRVDPQQPVTRIETLAQVRTRALASPTLIATLLGLFALLALVITAAGIGGVLAFSVNQRTQEIGIRMALGASRSAVLQMVLRQGLVLVLIGLAGGTVCALFLVRLMKEVLYGVSPTDPLTFLAVAGVLLTVAALACLLPARRATMVNPIAALRAN